MNQIAISNYSLFTLRISVWRILMSQKDNISFKIKKILPSGDRRGRSKYAIHRLPKLERGKLTFKVIKILQADILRVNRV